MADGTMQTKSPDRECDVPGLTFAEAHAVRESQRQANRDRFRKAGLSFRDAEALSQAQGKASAAATLVSILQCEVVIRDVEGGEGGLNGFQKGGIADAADWLASDVERILAGIGKN